MKKLNLIILIILFLISISGCKDSRIQTTFEKLEKEYNTIIFLKPSAFGTKFVKNSNNISFQETLYVIDKFETGLLFYNSVEDYVFFNTKDEKVFYNNKETFTYNVSENLMKDNGDILDHKKKVDVLNMSEKFFMTGYSYTTELTIEFQDIEYDESNYWLGPESKGVIYYKGEEKVKLKTDCIVLWEKFNDEYDWRNGDIDSAIFYKVDDIYLENGIGEYILIEEADKILYSRMSE